MSNTKVAPCGGVANIVNSLHKLEYESGRMDYLPVAQHRKLSGDHPAQRPKGDRPVPFHARRALQPGKLTDYGHNASGREAFELRDRDVEPQEKPNPFQRRNSMGCILTERSASQKRETISHKAFARVRTISPPLAMPTPRVEVSPWHESAEQYIKRKLTERWSPPWRSHSLSHSPAISEHAGSRTSPLHSHVDAPLAQEILQNIDRILTEHTETLKGVIEDSQRALQAREVLCRDEKVEVGNDGLPIMAGREIDWERSDASSTVPELLAAGDQTAEHMGLSLAGHHHTSDHPKSIRGGQRRGAVALASFDASTPRTKARETLGLEHQHRQTHARSRHRRDQHSSCSSSPKAFDILGTEPSYERHLPTFPSKDHFSPHERHTRPKGLLDSHTQHVHSPVHSRQMYYADHKRELPPLELHELKGSRPQHVSHTEHTLTIASHHPETSIPPIDTADHPPHDLILEHDASHLSHTNESTIPEPKYNSIFSPSPAFMEYDRFAGLVDRSSRNSINDIMEQIAVATATHTPPSRHAVDQVETQQEAIDWNVTKLGSVVKDTEAAGQAEPPTTAVKMGDVWLRQEREHEERNRERCRLKRSNTMDHLLEREGYQGQVRKRAKASFEPVAKLGKRSTQKMMDSILARQERDKEANAAWKH